jgi:hypothetical protein
MHSEDSVLFMILLVLLVVSVGFKTCTCSSVYHIFFPLAQLMNKRKKQPQVKRLNILLSGIFSLILLVGCDTIQNLPTNTTGGVFSLNGTWKLSSTTDNNAMVGSTIVVYPVVGNATVKSLSNNTYCVRDNDEFWKSIKKNGSGGFTISALAGACSGSPSYMDGTISVVNNDEIAVSTRTAGNSELVQKWNRVKKQ